MLDLLSRRLLFHQFTGCKYRRNHNFRRLSQQRCQSIKNIKSKLKKKTNSNKWHDFPTIIIMFHWRSVHKCLQLNEFRDAHHLLCSVHKMVRSYSWKMDECHLEKWQQQKNIRMKFRIPCTYECVVNSKRSSCDSMQCNPLFCWYICENGKCWMVCVRSLAFALFTVHATPSHKHFKSKIL